MTQGLLGRSGLPGRWAGRRRFVVLDTGFGLGLGETFLATWAAWRDDPQRCERLDFIAIEPRPPPPETLALAHRGTPLQALAQTLADAWPALTPNLQLLDFDAGRVRLFLAPGDPVRLLPQLNASVDAFFLDGLGLGGPEAAQDRFALKRLARLAGQGATAVRRRWTPALRDGLVSVGFEVPELTNDDVPDGFPDGFPDKAPDAEPTLARDHHTQSHTPRYAPRFAPRRTPGRTGVAWPVMGRPHAVVIGAGLAGASAADALSRSGWTCTVLDRHPAPAGEASGNPGGLFHATVHASDGVHARLLRSAALLAARRYRPLIDQGRVAGAVGGVFRREAPDSSAPAGSLEPTAGATGLARRLDARQARAATGLPLLDDDLTGWLFAEAGWIDPAGLVREWLATPGVDFRGGVQAQRLARDAAGHWSVHDAQDRLIAQGLAVVLAGGQSPPPAGEGTAAGGVMQHLVATRGQLTTLREAPRLLMPISGQGYALTLTNGELLFGATSQPGDDDPGLRDADHHHNLRRLFDLTGIEAAPGAPLHGRVGWRSTSPDRLPTVGGVPKAGWPGRADQARHVPRESGLFMLGALGSRGLTWAPLAAEVLSAWINEDTMPLEADLLDAIDPARWIVRAVRKASSALVRKDGATGPSNV